MCTDAPFALRDRTGGNPFFIREILRVATGGNGQLDLSLVSVPGTVRDVPAAA
ncbi:MAG TPA: hypothetical protein VF065_12135 [Ilumatobacter sp.]